MRDADRSRTVAPVVGSARIHPGAVAGTRLDAVDLLRGLVLVLMILGHTHDFLGAGEVSPRNLHDPAPFLTRWITQFSAPTLVLLAGISAYLYGAAGRSTADVSHYLLTRGFWLIVLEFSIVRIGWTFGPMDNVFITQVIWALGASMVVLAALIRLPRPVIAVVAVALIAGHNLLDGIRPSDFGAMAWVWVLLHEPARLDLGGNGTLFAVSPLIPWIGVMAAGYCLGPVFSWDRDARHRLLRALGIGLIAGFVLLRFTNLYGDPAPWAIYGDPVTTLLSFVNVGMYPPSLLFLMMTLGPALLLLAAIEDATSTLASRVTVFGRVPLFSYVVPLFAVHGLAVIFAKATIGDSAWLFGTFPPVVPGGYGLDLMGVYLVALMVVVALYPLCTGLIMLKRHGSEWWDRHLSVGNGSGTERNKPIPSQPGIGGETATRRTVRERWRRSPGIPAGAARPVLTTAGSTRRPLTEMAPPLPRSCDGSSAPGPATSWRSAAAPANTPSPSPRRCRA